MVVNAVSASKLMAHRLEMKTYRPDIIAKQQNSISLHDFVLACQEILAQKNYDADFLKAYFLIPETLDGFIGHINVLQHIMGGLQKQNKVKVSLESPVSTTLGGLKDGAAKEIENMYKKEELRIKDNIEEPVFESKHKDFAKPLRRYYQEVAKAEKAQFVEDEKAASFRAVLHRPNGEKL